MTPTDAEKIAALRRIVQACDNESSYLHNHPDRLAYRALLADLEAGEQGWRPIAEAPRDSTEILVWGPLQNRQVVAYDDDGSGYCWCSPEGFRFRTEAFTDWWPLPQPPAQIRKEVVSHTTGGQPDQPRPGLHNTAAPSPVGGADPRPGQRLWLWRHRDEHRGPHYLAFGSPYPTVDGGDPAILGEPCASAIVEPASAPCEHHWIGGNDGRFCTKCHAEQPFVGGADPQLSARQIGFRSGMRAAIQWLHNRAHEKNDLSAKSALNSAGFHLGNALARGDFRKAGPVKAAPAPTAGDAVERAENFIVSLLPYNLADRLAEATQALAQEFRNERAALLAQRDERIRRLEAVVDAARSAVKEGYFYDGFNPLVPQMQFHALEIALAALDAANGE